MISVSTLNNNNFMDSSGFFEDNLDRVDITIQSVEGSVNKSENHGSLKKQQQRIQGTLKNQQPEENEPLAVPESSSISSFDESSIWYNGSEFSCKICPAKIFYERQNLENHLKFKHRTSVEKYEDEHGCLETRAKVYECQLCHENVKHVRSVIDRHLR